MSKSRNKEFNYPEVRKGISIPKNQKTSEHFWMVGKWEKWRAEGMGHDENCGQYKKVGI